MGSMEKKNFSLTRMCQVDGVLCDPNGHGAFIKKLPVKDIKPCDECAGTGKDEVCRSCKGESEPGKKFVQGRWITCITCKGTQKVKNQECFHCKGTARSYPPHHYVEVDSDGDVIIDDPDEQEEIDALREEIKELDGDYDGRWGKTKLEQELIDLKKLKGVI